jgi:hypothetical protein
MNLVREHINFERGLNPKYAMGIGLTNQITSEHLSYIYMIQLIVQQILKRNIQRKLI